MNNLAPIGHNEMTPYDRLLMAVETAEDQASKCKVENTGDAEKATTLIKVIRDKAKDGEAAKKEEKAPHLEANKVIEARYKPLLERLSEASRSIQNKLNPFIQAERKKAEEIAKKEAEAAMKKADELGIDAPVIEKKPAYQLKTATGQSATTRTTWKWEIEDELEIPDEYFVVDEKKINAVVKAGTRKIPGIKIYPETTTVVR